ncbi:histidine kinase [Eubacteriales bacterium OttesenSCG-928-N13]|nr:histidine kinase [Eubacteriales bacterium OttesenSCG-928-N13]
MKKFLSFIKTLRFRIILITALCWLLPTLLLGWYLGGNVFGALRDSTETALISSTNTARFSTVAELDRLIALSKSATYDGTLTDVGARYLAGTIKYQDFYRECRVYMDQKFQRESLSTFAAFYLVQEPEHIIPTTDPTASNEQVTRFELEAQAQALALGEELDTRCRFMSVNGEVYLVRNLLTRKQERLGMLVIGIQPDLLLSPLMNGDDLWKDNIIIRLDDYSHLPESADPALMEGIEPGMHEQDDLLLVDGEWITRDYALSYRAIVDKYVVYAKIEEFFRLMAILLILLLPIMALIIVFADRWITKPLGDMAQASSRIEHGELGVTVDIPNKNDEIGQLARCYNSMSLQIKQLVEKSFEEELTLRDARIEALQSRINPHFMNNSLEMINWQARIEGSETISNMIDAMSTLINASLDRSNRRVVPLKEELEVADAYFYFLDQRFGIKLKTDRDIDPALLNVDVPRMAIQTLLENAVDHGIAPMGGGQIWLAVHAEQGALMIDVTNTGRRLTERDMQHISQLLSDDDNSMEGKLAERMGIRNINRRARLIYGEKANLQLSTDENGNTLARLTLPIEGA